MLTKDLLKYRVRSGKILPEFLDIDNPENRQLADDLVEIASECVGTSFGSAEEELLEASPESIGAAKGLVKLLCDRFECNGNTADIEAQRWNILALAQQLRTKAVAHDDFLEEVAAKVGTQRVPMQQGLYADLPAERLVTAFDKISSKELVQRYNASQVQGHLIRASQVRIEFAEPTLQERRFIFRNMKFHRLLSETSFVKNNLVMELGGPLSVFGIGGMYGANIANFFSAILNMKRWSLEATIPSLQKTLQLSLDQRCGLTSYNERGTGFVPPEFAIFVESFNEKAAEGDQWKAESAEEFLNLGEEGYCFPDFTLKNRRGKQLHIELFHKWHGGALTKRVEDLTRRPRQDLLIGITRSLAKDPQVAQLLGNMTSFEQQGFYFTDFPTPKVVFDKLQKIINSL